MTDSPDDRDGPSTWKTAAEVGSVGIEMGLSVAIGVIAGQWLDERFDTSPWWSLILLVCGLGAAAKALWRTAARVQRQIQDEDEGEDHWA